MINEIAPGGITNLDKSPVVHYGLYRHSFGMNKVLN